MSPQGRPRILPIRWVAPTLAALSLALGCRPPEVHMSSMPLAEPSRDETKVQSRTLPLALGKAFPRALDVLLDMGFQIRCANSEAGQVNIYKTWYDLTQAGNPQITLEATLLFRAETADSTRIRMSALGKWKLISIGGRNSADADVSGTAPDQDATDYTFFLDRLADRICSAR